MRNLFSPLTNSIALAPALAVSSLVVVLAMPANAVTFKGSDSSREASAKFTIVGDKLTVKLSNISTTDSLVPTDILTAVFFNLSGNRKLTKQSALVAHGSEVVYDPDGQPAGRNVGGEWAYRNDINVHGSSQGISSTGLSLFGSKDRFGGPNLAGPDSPNGLQYGLLSAGDNLATGNKGVKGSGGLIQNSVIFTFLGASGLTEDEITNVSFQYGTSLTEPHLSGMKEIPEPSTSGALGLFGLTIFTLIGKNKFNKA